MDYKGKTETRDPLRKAPLVTRAVQGRIEHYYGKKQRKERG